MDLHLKGKKAIVTGATRGIGRSIVEHLIAEGADIAFCARDAKAVESTLAELSNRGVRVFGAAVDVSDRDPYIAWLEQAAEQLGGVDIFIPNVSAGGGMNGEESWFNNFHVDVMGTVRGTETLLPHLKKSAGAIVMISTTAAVETFKAPTAYNVFKAGLLNYAKNLSNVLAPDHVRVNSVAPGPVYFEGGAWETIKANMTDFYESTLAEIPYGRMADPADIARAVVFLASPAAEYITGTTLVVDGGFTKRVDY
ncbi:MAG: SDR family oxidoreductase [Porticoccaceae bacterium]|nr:SDR family oxidoreductase [Porticoccaceae bacterium]